MISRCLLLLSSTLLGLVSSTTQASPILEAGNPTIGSLPNRAQACSPPALSRLIRHKASPGETLESIAQQYNLIPATLIGMNPALQSGRVAVGSEIIIPPYNGIRVQVPAGQTWRQVATTYKVRAGVLFEVNGCKKVPREVFVPGVNWSPNRPAGVSRQLAGYPLPQKTTAVLGYGWQIRPDTGKVFFNSGVDLSAAVGTPVRTVGAGTVAFAGQQGSYGNLVVVNHPRGRQTRYAQLNGVAVRAGQTVKQGDLLGTVGTTGKPIAAQPHLHFEVRYASSLGWVAEDPASYLREEGVRGRTVP